MARKKPQTKRERLESLIQQACHYAEWNLREYGQVPPSAMALTKEGIFLMTPPKLGSESEKDKFADAARMLAVGYRADAICMILESWAVFAKTPEQDITNCPPSQSDSDHDFTLLKRFEISPPLQLSDIKDVADEVILAHRRAVIGDGKSVSLDEFAQRSAIDLDVAFADLVHTDANGKETPYAETKCGKMQRYLQLLFLISRLVEEKK
jgi:hypothetical protein